MRFGRSKTKHFATTILQKSIFEWKYVQANVHSLKSRFLKDGPSEIATFELPSGFIFLLKLAVDAPREVQNQAFCLDRPSKINFQISLVKKWPHGVKSFFKRWSKRNCYFWAPKRRHFRFKIAIGCLSKMTTANTGCSLGISGISAAVVSTL